MWIWCMDVYGVCLFITYFYSWMRFRNFGLLCLSFPPPLVIRKRNITTQQIRASKQNAPPSFLRRHAWRLMGVEDDAFPSKNCHRSIAPNLRWASLYKMIIMNDQINFCGILNPWINFSANQGFQVGPFRRLGKSAQGGGSSGPTPGAMHLGVSNRWI